MSQFQIKIPSTVASAQLNRSENAPVAVKYHCDYCRKDISTTTRIKCAICTDFDLCIDCFSVGVQLGDHKNNHDYQVVDQMNFPLFSPQWGADEELLLLEAIGLYGLGNWSDIADHVSTKTSDECESHYFETYINTPTAPLPDMHRTFNISVVPAKYRRGKAKNSAITAAQLSSNSSKNKRNKRKTANTKNTTTTSTTGGQTAPGPIKQPDSGFMIYRNEFDVEYLNNAENSIATMPSIDEENDSPAMKRLKLAMLQIYSRRLQERYRVRDFIVQYRLLEVKQLAASLQSLPTQEREIATKMRVFMQTFPSRQDYDTFVEGLVAEQQLYKRIQKLQQLRSAGVKSLADAQKYERMLAPPPTPAASPSDNPFTSLASLSLYATKQQSYIASLGTPTTKKARAKQNKKNTCTPQLDITDAPDVFLLSPKERELCTNLRLYPKQYLIIKDTLLSENMKHGFLKKKTARQLLQLEPQRTHLIFQFFESVGWINQRRSSTTTS